jgi:hypothetical protein
MPPFNSPRRQCSATKTSTAGMRASGLFMGRVRECLRRDTHSKTALGAGLTQGELPLVFSVIRPLNPRHVRHVHCAELRMELTH